MSKIPFFSIIVPVFNREDYIARCIESIINQTFNDFELIIVDDGSKDKSFEICSFYAEKYDNIILIRNKENKGPVTARDTGLRKSTGKYICWVDSDDYIDNNRLERFFVEIEENHPDIVITGYIHEFSNGKKKVFHDAYPTGFYDKESYTKMKPHVFEFNNKTGMRNIHSILWAKATKRELMMLTYNKIPSNLWVKEDLTRTYIALLGAETISIIDDFSYHYMENPGQIMKSGYHPDALKWSIYIYNLIDSLNNEFKLTDEDISYAISQNIAISAVFALASERNNPNKAIQQEKIKEICKDEILAKHLTEKLQRSQNPYFRFVLGLIRKKRYRIINVYLKAYKLLLG